MYQYITHTCDVMVAQVTLLEGSCMNSVNRLQHGGLDKSELIWFCALLDALARSCATLELSPDYLW
jgi:hypothetical protein